MADKLADQNAAARLKEVIKTIATEAIRDALPRARFATVTAVDYVNGTATCVYPDEAANPFTVPTTLIAPTVGGVVRIFGNRGSRFIDEIISGAVVVSKQSAVAPIGMTIPASSDATSERAAYGFGEWQIGQDISANGTKDAFIYSATSGMRVYLPTSVTLGIEIPTSIDSGWGIGKDTGFGQIYNSLRTRGMTGSEYIILTDGNTTYVSAGASSDVYVRPNANSSTGELRIAYTGLHTLQGQLSLTGPILPSTSGGEFMRASVAGSFQTWYTGATRLGYLQGNSGNIILNSETGQLQLNAASGNSVYVTGANLVLQDGLKLRGGGNTTGGGSGGAGAVLQTDSGSNIWHGNWDGANLRFYVDSSNVKTFVDEHPVDKTKYLVHATSEGPTADVFYRGRGRLVDGFATIDIDLSAGMTTGTFEALTELDGRTISVQPILDHAKLLEMGPREIAGTANLCCTEVVNGQFHVSIASGMHVWDQVFHWQVWAIRKGHDFAVEPDKATTTVAGDGPYTYVTGAAPSSPWPRQSGQIETEVSSDATEKIEPVYDPEPVKPILVPFEVPEIELSPVYGPEHMPENHLYGDTEVVEESAGHSDGGSE